MTDQPPVRFPAISDEKMTAEQRRVAASIIQARKSFAGPFNAMLRSPAAADAMQQIGVYIRFKSPVPAPLKELAILMVARFWTSEFEWHFHRELAEAAGLHSHQVDALLGGRRPSELKEDEATVYRFVAQLLRSGHVTDPCFEEMKSTFGESLVTEFITIVGYYCTVSFFLNVDRHPRPDGAMPMPPLEQAPFGDA